MSRKPNSKDPLLQIKTCPELSGGVTQTHGYMKAHGIESAGKRVDFGQNEQDEKEPTDADSLVRVWSLV